MVAQDVLMNPDKHGCPVEEVVDTAHSFPYPWLMGDSKVAEGERGRDRGGRRGKGKRGGREGEKGREGDERGKR